MASPRSGTGADATTGATVQTPLTFRVYNMSGKEHEITAATTATVGELSRRFAEQVGVEPPNAVYFLLDTGRLDPLQPLGERFALGEVHELNFVVSEDRASAANRELLQAAVDNDSERFLQLLADGAPVTATMTAEDARRLGLFHFRGAMELHAGGTALHLAAARGWADGCRHALRAPGGAAAATLEAEVVFDADAYGGGTAAWFTPRQIWVELQGERSAVEVFGAV